MKVIFNTLISKELNTKRKKMINDGNVNELVSIIVLRPS